MVEGVLEELSSGRFPGIRHLLESLGMPLAGTERRYSTDGGVDNTVVTQSLHTGSFPPVTMLPLAFAPPKVYRTPSAKVPSSIPLTWHLFLGESQVHQVMISYLAPCFSFSALPHLPNSS